MARASFSCWYVTLAWPRRSLFGTQQFLALMIVSFCATSMASSTNGVSKHPTTAGSVN